MILPSTSAVLYAELARRIDSCTDRIAQATADRRENEITRSLIAVTRWLMIANALGGFSCGGYPAIEVRGRLGVMLIGLDMLMCPETAQDWAACLAHSAATVRAMHAQAEASDWTPTATTRWRELREIDRLLNAAHAHELAREAARAGEAQRQAA